MVTAFVLIDCGQEAIPEVARQLCDLKGVSEVYSVTGEFDLVAIVRVAEFDEVAEVIPNGIAKLPGVVTTRTHVAFQAYSRLDLEAMFSIGAD
ncbi:Lrp/AsnC ligand binding domain-containing protein [Mycobacterium sp. Aquia_216]|uniref:Lrp/AsnC family transcriptional regulator n=1 Tax=Mycobacterium sp. Aquia_216 TaxID=2991729 RepID=UPI00227C1A8B|nr:Lrp/AsnC ligand binding domain-containing protein [Mycobacterium sp. Aquia_216]WAJ46627.1 Lrp/AsnC ligand binding domain-containing protein [Mycobacterium sp. Aquia_216]